MKQLGLLAAAVGVLLFGFVSMASAQTSPPGGPPASNGCSFAPFPIQIGTGFPVSPAGGWVPAILGDGNELVFQGIGPSGAILVEKDCQGNVVEVFPPLPLGGGKGKQLFLGFQEPVQCGPGVPCPQFFVQTLVIEAKGNPAQPGSAVIYLLLPLAGIVTG